MKCFIDFQEKEKKIVLDVRFVVIVDHHLTKKMSEHLTWVSDKLHELVGISDKSIAEFIIGLGTQSKTPAEFIEKIKDTDCIEINDKVSLFATELHSKIPRELSAGEKKRAENRRREEEARMEQKKNKGFKMVDFDDEEELNIKPKKKKKKKKEEHKNDDDVDEFERMETERQEDLKERDAFHQRMVAKDKEKQRNIATKSDTKAFEEAAKRLAQEKEDREKMIPELRKQSRRDYLVKRKEDKIQELEADILDDEYLFADSNLTEREKQQKKYRKTILELAKQHDKADEIEKVDRYYMPDEKRKNQERWLEGDEKEKAPNYEQKKWEEEHLAQSQYRVGARDAKERRKEKEKEYDYILDEEIEFVQALSMPGTKDQKKEPELSEHEKKRKTLKEVKESLPVFPFRDDFIEAVKEHQVLIVEGETGSGKTTQLPQYLHEAGLTADGM